MKEPVRVMDTQKNSTFSEQQRIRFDSFIRIPLTGLGDVARVNKDAQLSTQYYCSLTSAIGHDILLGEGFSF